MGSFFSVSNILWASQPLLQSAVLYSLWRKRLHKEFPVFIAYLLAQIAIVVVLLPFFNFASDQIFYRYWTFLNWGASFIGFSLAFKVLHEIFMDVFRPYHSMKDLGTILFRWGALVMLLRREPYDATPVVLIASVFLWVAGGLADITSLTRSQLPSTLPDGLARGVVMAAIGLGGGLIIGTASRLRRPYAGTTRAPGRRTSEGLAARAPTRDEVPSARRR